MMVMPFSLAVTRISRARCYGSAYCNCHFDFVRTYTLGDTLGNDGNGADLGEVHQLHGGAVDGTGGSEVDDGVNVRVLGNGLLDVLVDGKKGLAGAPVHLADELTAEGVDDTSHGGGGTLADEIKVEHALHGSGLHATGVC